MGVELDRCRINSMVDNPYFNIDEDKVKSSADGPKCRDGRTSCDDCRATPPSEILSVHFTICGKPWLCNGGSWGDPNTENLCSKLHSEWFRIRRSFEENRADSDLRQLPDLVGSFKPEIYFGYCKEPGEKGYLPVKI